MIIYCNIILSVNQFTNNINIEVTARPNDNNLDVKVFFTIKGSDIPPQSFSFLLEPTR